MNNNRSINETNGNNSDVLQLLHKTKPEVLEDTVEKTVTSAIKHSKEMQAWARKHPGHAAAYAGGIVGLFATLYWGIPFAINKYHEHRAENDIQQAEEKIFTIAQNQENTFKNLEAQRFVIRDDIEHKLEEDLNGTAVRIHEWNEQVKAEKQRFELGKFKEVRAVFETEDNRTGLLDTIDAQFKPIETISVYITTLRTKRDQAFGQEQQLSSLMKETPTNTDGLHNTLGSRLEQNKPVLDNILRIAIRDEVKAKGNKFYNGARSQYLSATRGFATQNFVHYTAALDNNLDIPDYDNVLGAQQNLLSNISSGDGQLSSLHSYLNTLQEQWYTILTKRWESSHEHHYTVRINNPSFREWSEQDCSRQKCDPTYSSKRVCRSRANQNGSVDQQCTTVRERTGQSCRPDCRTVTKDNGQPRQIDDPRVDIIPEYWVRTETHRLTGTSSSNEDLKEVFKYRQPQHQLGYQHWKPYGDDLVYEGVGNIGSNNERAHLVTP